MRAGWAMMAALAGPLPRQDLAPAPTGDVVVQALPIRCRPRAGDPQDALTAAAAPGRWTETMRDDDGGYRLTRTVDEAVRHPLAALGTWTRQGWTLGDYTFRTPADDSPSCVARHGPSPIPDEELDDNDVVVVGKPPPSPKNGAIMQRVRADAYRCRTVRFTAFFATRQADGILWLNAGYGRWSYIPARGSHKWRAVGMEDGPVGWWYPWTGFGVQVEHGDAWLYQPKIEFLADDKLRRRQREAQRLCRERQPPDKVAALIDRPNRTPR